MKFSKYTILSLIAVSITAFHYFFIKEGRIYQVSKNRSSKRTSPSFEQEVVQFGPLTPEFVTVVSIYFNFNQTKHTAGHYDMWVGNMLQSVEAPLVMYTNKELLPKFKELRKDSKYRTTFYIYKDLWDIMRELEIQRNRSYLHNYWHVQHELDTEKFHTPELYAVWNLKPYYTNKIVEINPYNSEFFIYTDAGAWREKAIPKWPDVSFVKKVAQKTQDMMLFGQLEIMIHYSPWDNVLEGTFFAGSGQAISKYQGTFYDLHDARMDNNQFMGVYKIINSILLYHKHFIF